MSGILFMVIIGVAAMVAYTMYDDDLWKRRRKELLALARHFRWSFDPQDDDELARHASDFELFATGSEHIGYNTLIGVLNTRCGRLQVRTGDYSFVVGSGKHRYVQHGSYLLAAMPFAVPEPARLSVRREDLGDTVDAMIGFEDIDFESDEFSRLYFVKGRDRKFAYAVIHPQMIEYFLEQPPRSLELRGSEVLLFDLVASTWSAAEIADAVSWMQRFVELWPDYLIQDLAAQCEHAEADPQ
jgi:hypothetical protein